MVRVGKLLSFVTGVLIAIFALSSVVFCHKKCKVDNELLLFLFKSVFKEPIETMYFLTNDFKVYYITSNQENGIHFKMEDIKKALKEDDCTISDIILIVHNHIPLAGYDILEFSKGDIYTWQTFRGEGFTGKFYLYVQGLGRIYKLTGDEDDC